MIWAQIPAAEYVANQATALGVSSIHSLFDCIEDNKRTIKDIPSEWNEDYDDFGNWWRLSALMSLASYFETYLATIIAVALESDPGVIHNVPGKIDGVVILKYSSEYNYDKHVNACITGDWPKRISEYTKLFKQVPTVLPAMIAELSELQKIRNRVGHSFGRDIKNSRTKGVRDTLAIERVSIPKLKSFLKVVYEAALIIDHHLCHTHIGDYETIFYYHQLRSTIRTNHLTREREAALKKNLGKMATHAHKDYCRELVDYYEKL